jgi:hypothetical protein
MKIWFSWVVSCGPPFSNESRRFLRTLRRNGYSWEPVVIFDTWDWDLTWRAAFALLPQASLTPSSCYRLGRRSDWAPFWCGACARAPGHHSWSVRARARTSAASCTSGSLGPRVNDRRVAKLLTWPWWSSAALVTAPLETASPLP